MNYISLHQPGGVLKNWKPDGRFTYRVRSINVNLRQFKLWIPPGIEHVSLMSHVGQNSGSSYCYVARLGKEPAGTPTAGQSNGYTLSELAAGDCFGKNSSGYVIYTDNIKVSNPPTIGQWLYINFKIGKGNLIDTSGSIQVNEQIYKDWYNSAMFGADGDPIVGVAPQPVNEVDITINAAQYAAIQSGYKINWIVI
jgi:hypothetical protein